MSEKSVGTRKLHVLKRLLLHVFIPIEKQETKYTKKTRTLLEKFVESIEHTE